MFEGLSTGVRGDALACRGHPYIFLSGSPRPSKGWTTLVKPLNVCLLNENFISSCFFCSGFFKTI